MGVLKAHTKSSRSFDLGFFNPPWARYQRAKAQAQLLFTFAVVEAGTVLFSYQQAHIQGVFVLGQVLREALRGDDGHLAAPKILAGEQTVLMKGKG